MKPGYKIPLYKINLDIRDIFSGPKLEHVLPKQNRPNPDIRDIFSGPKLERVLPKQNRPNPDIRDFVSGPDNALISGLHSTSNCYFQHNTFYKQKFGLLLGSPLNRVLARIYLEFLESGPFIYIIPSCACYFRYTDNILLIYPQGLNLNCITGRLNNHIYQPLRSSRI